MKPSNSRLLQGAHDATRAAARRCEDKQSIALLEAAGKLLNELMLRQDREFYQEYYSAGRAHCVAGQLLLAESGSGGHEGLRSRIAQLPVALDADLRFDVFGQKLDELAGILEQIVSGLRKDNDESTASFLKAVTDWELRLYSHRLKEADPVADVSKGDVGAITRNTLREYLRTVFPRRPDIDISRFEPLLGGFSKTTILFETHDPVLGVQEWVLRAEQPIQVQIYDGSDVVHEYGVLGFLFKEGIPVAEPLWLEKDRQRLGVRFMITRKAVGSNFGDAQRAEGPLKATLLEDIVRVLAQIHAAQPQNVAALRDTHLRKWLGCKTVTQAILAAIDHWRGVVERDSIVRSPLLERGFKWLAENVPDCDEPPVLTHGDYGLHNILVQNDQVSAVLDWECAMVGDPAAELAVLQNVYGSTVVGKDQLVDWYRQRTGRRISEYRLAYQWVFYIVIVNICCLLGLSYFESERRSNINLCMLGMGTFPNTFGGMLNEAIVRATAAKARESAAVQGADRSASLDRGVSQ